MRPCEFCGAEPSDRFRPVTHAPLEIVDCERCGVFALSAETSAAIARAWTADQRVREVAMIRAVNRVGLIFRVSGGEGIVDDWGLLPDPAPACC
ncbi:MAG TPA: hypothetical protein VHB25_13490 [Gemmatimonadaceae bacterium]|nr:hypothetical protein [Gemmatimonadaceae bacterium]